MFTFASTNSTAGAEFKPNFNKAFSGSPNPADKCRQTIGKHLVQSQPNTFGKLEKALLTNTVEILNASSNLTMTENYTVMTINKSYYNMYFWA